MVDETSPFSQAVFLDATARPQSRPLAVRGAAWLVFAVAFLVRLVPALTFPGNHHPDEIFQSVEQAHRLVFGYGLVPWEFQLGTRSWILPGVLAGLMTLSRAFGDGPAFYLPVIHGAVAALSATSVACCYLWGRRFHGPWAGLAAAAVPAFWPDALYFGARTLSESVAAPVLVMGFYLLAPGREVTGRARLLAAGALLALAVVLRVQLAPAALAATIFAAVAWPPTVLLPLLGGEAILVAFSGTLDAVTWGEPWQSLWRNVSVNAFDGASSTFGTAPWSYYLSMLAAAWSGYVVVLLGFALWGARRAPLLLIAALAILLPHMLIAHKELRFIYPAVLLVLILAGLGCGEMTVWIGRRLAINEARMALTMLCGIAASAALLAVSPFYRALWQGGHDMVRADLSLAGMKNICGIGSYESYGGYAYFHQRVPYFWPLDRAELVRDLPAVNTLIAPRDVFTADYRIAQCFGTLCVGQRPGSCQPLPMTPMPRPAGMPSS